MTHSAATCMSSPLNNQWTNRQLPLILSSQLNVCVKEVTRMPLCCIKCINCISVKKKVTSKKSEPLVSEKTQTLTWSAALTLCAPGLPAGVGYEPSPPRSPLETSCSLPSTHLSDLRGRGREDKQRKNNAINEDRPTRHSWTIFLFTLDTPSQFNHACLV